MAQKSSLKTKLPEDVLEAIHEHLRNNTLTVKGMIEFCAQKGFEISNGSAGRYKKSFEDSLGDLREGREVAKMLVGQLGVATGADEQAQMLIEVIRNFAFKMVMNADDDELKSKQLVELSRTIKNLASAQILTTEHRKEIRKEALASAADAVEELGREEGMSLDKINLFKASILGVSVK